jgi:hypothetical protein
VEQILFKIKTMLLDAGCDPNDCIEVGTVKSAPKKRIEKEIDFTGDSDEHSVAEGSDLDFLDGMEDDDIEVDDAPVAEEDGGGDSNDDDDEEKSVSPVIKKKTVIRPKPAVVRPKPAVVVRTKKVPIPQESSEEQPDIIPERKSRPMPAVDLSLARKKKRVEKYDTEDSEDEVNNENSQLNMSGTANSNDSY